MKFELHASSNGVLCSSQELGWNPANMAPGRPGKPEESSPNPQSCDIGYSQSKEWSHQG